VIVDTSALIAVLRQEPGSERMAEALFSAESVRISTVTLVEQWIVASSRLGPLGPASLDGLLEQVNVLVEPFTGPQAARARLGWLRFGRGRHPAALNFGDCFAYAVATEMDEPLLFSGAEFSRTDVRSARQGTGL
jgi:ribonuclease VapC